MMNTSPPLIRTKCSVRSCDCQSVAHATIIKDNRKAVLKVVCAFHYFKYNKKALEIASDREPLEVGNLLL